jgi:hypothetical protein
VDYAFSPGPTMFDQQMGRLLDDRPTTDLLPASLGTVERFVDELETLASVVKPVESMFVASHANDAGQLKIVLDAAHAATKTVFVNFEDLEAAVTSGSVDIPAALRTLPDGSAFSATRVRIRGCRVGRAAPFMAKLKEALGGVVAVTAPKHFHFVYPDKYPNAYGGMFEWMLYDFAIHSKTALGRPAILAALKAKGYDFYDGTKVPDAWWNGWVPAGRATKKTRSSPMTLLLGSTVGANVTDLVVTNGREWRHTNPRVFKYELGLASEPPTQAAKLARLRTNLEPLDTMSPLHEFPMWERLGYLDFDDFFTNVVWQMTWVKKTKTLVCRARRHEYHLLMPITTRTATRPDRGDLIFNFFPHGGGGAAFFSMRDDDDFLFHTA